MAEHLKLYFNRNKEDNWYVWEDQLNQPENEAGREFSYAGYEICLHCMVDLETGHVESYGIEDGNSLVEFEKPVRI